MSRATRIVQPEFGGPSIVQGDLLLAVDTWVVAVHGVTGQDAEEGILAAGTLVRDVRESREVGGDGSYETITRFLASTDDGKTWYEHRTFGRLRTHYRGMPEATS